MNINGYLIDILDYFSYEDKPKLNLSFQYNISKVSDSNEALPVTKGSSPVAKITSPSRMTSTDGMESPDVFTILFTSICSSLDACRISSSIVVGSIMTFMKKKKAKQNHAN